MKLRVVIQTIGPDNRGGARIYIELANILSRRSHQVTILIPRKSSTACLRMHKNRNFLKTKTNYKEAILPGESGQPNKASAKTMITLGII
jgi:hypothetical protein